MGTHAQNLYMQERETTERELNFLKDKNLEITMISDYLDISLSADFEKTIEKSEQLVVLANWFNTNKIRTFAGQKGARTSRNKREKSM